MERGALLTILAVSATVTAAAMTVGETIAAMDLAPVEAAWFAQLPYRDAYPVAVVMIPFGVIAIALLADGARQLGHNPRASAPTAWRFAVLHRSSARSTCTPGWTRR